MMFGLTVFVTNLVLVLVMTGTVWVRQLIYYPLYAFVGAEQFPAYQRENHRRVRRSLQPATVVTLLATLLLVFARPSSIPLGLALTGLATEGLVAAVTGYEVRRQRELEITFDSDVLRRLLSGNWIRTAGLTAHSVLVVSMLLFVAGASS